ncbi:MAG: hypothetical protein PHR35_20790 [Kiritimatiellae bacterium]|nr:hypothetical protein [Kiritimatiellia bacterium]
MNVWFAAYAHIAHSLGADSALRLSVFRGEMSEDEFLRLLDLIEAGMNVKP